MSEPVPSVGGRAIVSPLLIEIGITVLAVGIFAYMLVGGLGGGSLAMVVVGILITIGGFARGRRGEDRDR